MRDGQGNLLAMDGRPYAPVHVGIGRNLLKGPGVWEFGVAWGLRKNPRPGERVYEREISVTFSVTVN